MSRIGESPGSWRVKHDKISPEMAKKIYDEVLKLSIEDQSPVSLARRLSASHSLSLSPGTIRHWIVGDRNLQRRNVFKQKPSSALSYIIGANIGDGCTIAENWIVKLEVTDRDFAETFNYSMAELFHRHRPNRILVRQSEGRLPMYIVKYSSKQLVELLRIPLKKLLAIAFAFPRDFLRGFFDAEGHVDVRASRNFELSVGAENSDKWLLMRVGTLLKQLNISSRLYRKRKAGSIKVIRNQSFVMKQTSYAIDISRLDDVRRFAKMVDFSIHRKAKKLEDALSIIGSYTAGSRPTGWKRLSKKQGEWVRRSLSPKGIKEYK
ncbi:MAG TPA: LAGLIDADG family homing endonuclease [Nitrososphaerales archaeon]|nr:LAGLIDADG family homing endonuclease [Nitrososphaerales archaeon]